MTRPAFYAAALAFAAALTASAADFPLTFKTIPAKDVMSFPGGSGLFGPLYSTKPSGVRQEPKAVSRHPLYAEFRAFANGTCVARLDESQGDGKGYDQLIVDLNQNGDLSDDPVVSRAVLPGDRKPSSGSEQVLFGPIEAPADKAIAGHRPVCFAEAYIFNRQILSSGAQPRFAISIGQLRLKAGWYLETTVELNGHKHHVGVYDGDNNLRLGDLAKPQITRSGGKDSWYFRNADVWLVDANNSGSFENDPFQSEASPFGPVLYLGATPCKVALGADCKSLQVEPWSGPLAEVALQPHGDQVRSVTLAWERPDRQWQLIRPSAADGKIQVPPGNYRLYSCDLLAKDAPENQVMASATKRELQKPFSFVPDQANSLRCGAPLEIKVTTQKSRGRTTILGGLAEDFAAEPSTSTLRINALVIGAGGETYSAYAKGENLGGKPPRPAFTILDADGKEVAKGNLEFG